MNQPIDHQYVEHLVKKLQQQLDNSDIEPPREDGFYWTLQALIQATGGSLLGPVTNPEAIRFDSISTDTRTLVPGALYIAIKGENFDGHCFVEQAVKQGAAAVLVEEDMTLTIPGVVVENTRLGLGLFAKWHRQHMPVSKLIAITGSNGKTTVKTLLNNMFTSAGNTLATQGNLNNDLGVPRTLLNLRPEHEYAVIEMGANHQHEIDYLTSLALPDIAILNNAAGAHLEGFGSLEGVIQSKGEIFQGLNQKQDADNTPLERSGVAVINTDSEGYDEWQRLLETLGVVHVVRFGTKDEADVKMQNVVSDSSEGIQFDLCTSTEKYHTSMPMLGRHNAMNAAACSAVALAAGLSWPQILSAIEAFTGVPGRLQKTSISHGWLIDDSYNANPESVKAGIDALTTLSGRSILCLGAMAEIGESSDEKHAEVAEYARQKGVSHLFVYGQATAVMPSVFGEQSHYFECHQSLIEAVSDVLDSAQGKMNLLIKGSRSASMEKVTQPLLQKYKAKN